MVVVFYHLSELRLSFAGCFLIGADEMDIVQSRACACRSHRTVTDVELTA